MLCIHSFKVIKNRLTVINPVAQCSNAKKRIGNRSSLPQMFWHCFKISLSGFQSKRE